MFFLMSTQVLGLSQNEGDLQKPIHELILASRNSDRAWNRLVELCDTFGPRFSGSDNLEKAIDWVVDSMKEDGFDVVETQTVKVPHWSRGTESLTMTHPRAKSMPMLGLGGSVGTPAGGISAPILVLESLDAIQQVGDAAKGKIVVFNVPYTSYGETVQVRVRGAIEAAKAGAVASLIRSVGPFSLQTPHTGGMAYQDNIPKIPHAAITLEDAEELARFQRRGIQPILELHMEAQTLPDALSRNIIAEIRGSQNPEEVIVVGGHIDSWDVGQGAQDDGGGCMVAWEAARLILAQGHRPRRTIRVVLWTNEENGLRGAQAYASKFEDQLNHHVLAIESDTGIGEFFGFKFTGSEAANRILAQLNHLTRPLMDIRITPGAGGADIRPLLVEGGVPIMDLDVDRTRYFWYHHTAADTMDKIDPTDLKNCIAGTAAMLYFVANYPEPLPR